MISDVLSQAVDDIRDYQRDLPEAYDDMRADIEAVLAPMDRLRRRLDSDFHSDIPAALRSLAVAVVELVDGCGGDLQERDRAGQIAEALRCIADGVPVTPLVPHDTARLADAG